MDKPQFFSMRLVGSCIALAIGWSVQAAGEQTPGPGSVALVLPAASAPVRCAVVANGNAVATSEGPRLTVPCSLPRGSVRCDGAGIEPLDVPIDAVCRNPTLSFTDGVPTSVALPLSSARLKIEWLELRNDALMVTASRTIGVSGGMLTIPVGNAKTRYLRFTFANAAPVTLPATEVRDRTSTLPTPLAGGEIIVIRKEGIRPDAYRLHGPSDMFIRRPDASIGSVTGVAPGEYAVEAVYDGDVTVVERPVRVSIGRTTIVDASGEVGAATITTQDSACRSSSLRLTRVDAPPPSSELTEIATRPAPGDCSWYFAGLRPALYRAELLRQDGAGGATRPFTVQSQTVARVDVVPSSTRLSGRVLLNGRPVPSVEVELVNRASAVTNVVASTDSDGRYSIGLGASGVYYMFVRHPALPTVSRSIDVKDGENVFDLSLTGGELAVKTHSPRQGRILLKIQSKRDSYNEESDGLETVVKQGIPFGVYTISAEQPVDGGRTLVSTVETVTLDASSPKVAVEIEVVENKAALFVRDESGRPVRGATVRPANPFDFTRSSGRTISPESDGSYSLDDVAPGTPLIVSAGGFVPSCRYVPSNRPATVILSRGRSVQVRFPVDFNRRAMTVAAVGNVPGSDCPVPLAAFAPQVVGASDPPPLALRIENFANAVELTLIQPNAVRRILVPDVGDVVIRR